MQPIPLDPISVERTGPIYLLVVCILGLALLVVGLILYLWDRHRGTATFTGIVASALVVGTLAGGLGGIFYFASPDYYTRYREAVAEQAQKHDQAVQRAVREEYNSYITEGQARVINYPETAPQQDFAVLGSFESWKQTDGASFEARTVYLVWADKKLTLSWSSDGSSFTPVPPYIEREE